jgi:hypothetical protein
MDGQRRGAAGLQMVSRSFARSLASAKLPSIHLHDLRTRRGVGHRRDIAARRAVGRRQDEVQSTRRG